MKVTVFKSERTGELFETEEEYNLHLEKMAEREDPTKSRRGEIRHHPRLRATSVQDLEHRVFRAINELYGSSSYTLKTLQIILEGTLIDIKNTWNCVPISILNNRSIPKHYDGGYGRSLGWKGRIIYTFTEDFIGFQHLDFPMLPGINIGSCRRPEFPFEYEFVLTLFLEDFPLLKQQYERYIELVKKEEEWKNTIETLFQKELNSDKVVIHCNEHIADYLSQINALHSSLETKVKIKQGREILFRKEILFSHPFPELQEMEKLKEEFKFS